MVDELEPLGLGNIKTNNNNTLRIQTATTVPSLSIDLGRFVTGRVELAYLLPLISKQA